MRHRGLRALVGAQGKLRRDPYLMLWITAPGPDPP